MNLEQQVVSLEYAEKLKELGVGQQSLFYWFYTDAPLKDGSRWELKSAKTLHDSDFELGDDWCSAFTVAELGEMFDRELKIHSGKTVYGLELYYCSFMESSLEEYWNKTHCFGGDTEANARAKMLVHLIENNLYDPKTQKTQTKV